VPRELKSAGEIHAEVMRIVNEDRDVREDGAAIAIRASLPARSRPGRVQLGYRYRRQLAGTRNDCDSRD
jgi:hypothetical protein